MNCLALFCLRARTARFSVQKRIAQLEHRFAGCKVIVGVDRLDYIKGVPQKLHALELFLTQHPEWIGKVVLAQLAVPSRQDVEEYQNLRATVFVSLILSVPRLQNRPHISICRRSHSPPPPPS